MQELLQLFGFHNEGFGVIVHVLAETVKSDVFGRGCRYPHHYGVLTLAGQCQVREPIVQIHQEVGYLRRLRSLTHLGATCHLGLKIKEWDHVLGIQPL